LSLGDIKTDGWLRHLDNPLRDWLDQHEQAGIACAAYSAAPPGSQLSS
jgi:hypothetical protein